MTSFNGLEPIGELELRVAYALGYSSRQFDSRLTSNPLQVPDYSVEDREILLSLLAELALIDQQIKDAMPDSMAEKVSDISVNFHRHILILKEEGSRILNELAQFSGLPLAYNRYRARKAGELGITPLVARNYF